MLNYPKTGSSFARKVVKDLYAHAPRRWFPRRYCKELILPNIRHPGEPDQHGCYSQIPRIYRHREVVSVFRSPYERFLSAFEFRHWAYHPQLPVNVIKRRFPKFPDFALDEYIDYVAFVSCELYGTTLGAQTPQFLQLFSRKFPSSFPRELDLKTAVKGLAKVTFLRQENLNRELIQLLSRKGFSDEAIAFIETHEPVNVTVGKSGNRKALWTPKAVNYVSNVESLLLQILDTLGITFEIPGAMEARVGPYAHSPGKSENSGTTIASPTICVLSPQS